MSTKIQATSLIAVDPGATYPEGSPAVQPILVDKEMSIDDIEKYGVHGHVIDFDMSSLLQNLQAEGDSTATLNPFAWNTKHTISLLLDISSIQNRELFFAPIKYSKNCLINPGNIFLA